MKLFRRALTVLTLATLLIPAVAMAGPVSRDGYYKGIKLCGKVKVVTSNADIKVKVVSSFPDLKVKTVTSFPDQIGKWQFVESFPDFTIQYVESFPDIKIQFVESFPGVN